MTKSNQSERSAVKPPLITVSDIGIALGLLPLAVLAWTLPHRQWQRVARVTAPLVARMQRPGPDAIGACVARTAGTRLPDGAGARIVREIAEAELLRNLRVVSAATPFARAVPTTLEGREHIDAALARGKGVILWDGHFAHAGLLTKVAVHRAGLTLVHLSHPRHGFSDTRFGMRVLNAIWRAAEAPYLEERVVLSLAGPVAAMRHLLERLAANAVVSISVRDTGSQPVFAPFLEGILPIATGAPDLAFRSGAALIPVFTVIDGAGNPVATAEPPIELPRDGPRRAAVEAAVAAYAARLERWVLRHPGQWFGWLNLALAEGAEPASLPPTGDAKAPAPLRAAKR